MKRARSFLCILFFCASTLSATAATFPTVEASDLNKREVTLPQDLPAERTIVMMAFLREQQEDLNTWIYGMELDEAFKNQWVELPVLSRGARLFRGFIDGGMRSGITRIEDRARTITIYENRKKFLAPLEIEKTDRVYVMVVERNGDVLLTIEGTYTEEGAAQIREVMAQ